VVDELDGIAATLGVSSVTALASGVAVTVTNWTVVVVMVEVKLVLQEEELVLSDAGATAVLDTAAMATGTLEKGLLAASMDDSRGIGLTVTVLAAVVGDSIAEPPKSVPFV
jgi:hypothetical protein